MTSCNVFARAGFYEDASYTLIKVLTAANNAIMAGGDAPVFTAVHVVWHDACGTDTGLWHEHARSMSAVPVVALNICGATDLETLLEQGNTTAFPAATCNTCGVKVWYRVCDLGVHVLLTANRCLYHTAGHEAKRSRRGGRAAPTVDVRASAPRNRQ